MFIVVLSGRVNENIFLLMFIFFLVICIVIGRVLFEFLVMKVVIIVFFVFLMNLIGLMLKIFKRMK